MDREAYVSAVMAHKDRLHTYAAWLLHNVDEATDVTQEALTRLWANRDCVGAPAARSWLMRTAHHLCLDRLRRRATRAGVNGDALAGLPDAAALTPEQSAAVDDLRRTVAEALANLSDRDRTMLLMREIEQMTYDEMSRMLGVPLGTLKAGLHRARERLRRQLSGAGIHP